MTFENYPLLFSPLVLQLPELRKRSRWDYLKKRETEKMEDLEADIKDDEYLFSTEELTEREKRDLDYKRTLRDLAKDYKKAGAKEQEERKNRYYMPEEKRSKVSSEGSGPVAVDSPRVWWFICSNLVPVSLR